MLLAWAVSCDSYEFHEDGTVNIFGAGFDTFRVDGLPSVLELNILVRLLMMEGERGEIELHLLGPETDPLVEPLRYEVEAEPRPNHRGGFLVSQIEALEVEFPARSEGVYSAEIYVGKGRDFVSEERRRSIFFSVIDGLPG